MICGKCHKRYEGGPEDACPYCGARRGEAEPGFVKTSTILISAVGGEGVYHSLEEIPATLRSELLKSTNGADSGTILIADRKGREEIARAVRRFPSAEPAEQEAGHPGRGRRVVKLAAWVSLLLTLLLVVAMWVWR